MGTDDFGLGCTINGLAVNTGDWNFGGYLLHADTRSQRQQTWRKQTVENPWVEGSYDVQAVRGNATELVAVYAIAADENTYKQLEVGLTDLLSYASFQTVWTLDGYTEAWDCTFSDFTVERSKEFQLARVGLIRINLSRRPKVTVTYTDGSQYVA